MKLKYASTKTKVGVSVLAQFAGQLIAGFIGVFVLKIMTGDLGTRDYGIYVTALAYVSTFSLLTDLGINSIAAREIVKKPHSADEIINHNMGLRLGLCVVIIPFIIGLSYIFYPSASSTLRYAISLMSLYLLFDAIWATAGAYFSSQVRSDVNAVVTTLKQSLFFGCVVLVSLLNLHLFGYIISYVGTTILGSVVIFWLVRKELAIRPRYNLVVWKRILNMSISVGVISIINLLYLKADGIIISIILGPALTGIYGVAYLLIGVMSGIPGYLMNALIPSLATASSENYNKIVNSAIRLLVTVGLLLFAGSFVLSKDIVKVVSNAEFIGAAEPFAILAAATVFSFVSNVFGYAAVAINKHHKYVYISVFTLISNVVANILLIPHYKLIGAACATLATEILNLTLSYHLFKRQTDTHINLNYLWKPILIMLVVIGCSIYLRDALGGIYPLPAVVLVGTFMVVLYSVLIWFFRAVPPEIEHLITKIRVAIRQSRYAR